MGLSPLLVKEVFAIIKKINRDLGVTISAGRTECPRGALRRHHGYFMEQGKVVLDGTADELRDNEDVGEGVLSRRRRRPAQELQESEKLQATQAML